MKNRVFIITFAVIIILAAAIIYFINNFSSNNSVIAEIVRDGTIVKTVNLNAVTEPQDIIITSEDGGTNTVHIEHNAISISEADCPDKLCVKQGRIQNEVYPIVCLPHKLVVRIIKSNCQTHSEVDTVTGR